MNRSGVREIHVSGTSVPRGQILVPTQIGDDVHGLLGCAAAPLVAGSLVRKGRPVSQVQMPRLDDPLADGEATLFLATCAKDGGRATAIGAATAPQDRLAATLARAAVEEWAAIAGPRTLLAAASPWCGGALRAARMARQAATSQNGQGAVRLLGPLALPPETTAYLAELGAVEIGSLAEAAAGDVVVFPAHGVRPAERKAAAERGLTVVDATCPVIARAQDAATRVAERGQHLVLVSQPGAAATQPIASHAVGHFTIVESVGGTAAMEVGDAGRLLYMLQPGIPVESLAGIATALRSRYPAATGPQPDGLCYAASDRAATVHAVAIGSDVLFVLGDAQSADARQLCAQAREAGTKVQLIGAVSDITPAMLAGAQTVGSVESTSAQAGLAAAVIAAIAGLGPLTVARRQVSTEMADSSVN